MSTLHAVILVLIAIVLLVLFVISASAEQDRKRDIEKRLRNLENKK